MVQRNSVWRMILEIIIFLGVIIILLTYFASKETTLYGIFAGLLCLILGLLVLATGMQIRTGETTTGTSTLVNGTTTYNTTLTYVWTDTPPLTPLLTFNQVMGMIFILLGLMQMGYYTLESFNDK